MRYLAGLLLFIALAGCTQAADQPAAGRAAPAAELDTAVMPMQGMAGMGSGPMMAQMRELMRTEHSDTGHTMMTGHLQMATQMLAQMEKDMQSMKPDPRWSALLDSVRKDMAAMPAMEGGMMQGRGRGAMSPAMTAHRNRMMRLMDLHQSLMQDHTTTR